MNRSFVRKDKNEVNKHQRKLLMKYRISAAKKRRLGLINKESVEFEKRVLLLNKNVEKCNNTTNLNAKCRRMIAVKEFLSHNYKEGEKILKPLKGVHAKRALKLLKSFYTLYDSGSRYNKSAEIMYKEKRRVTKLPPKTRILKILRNGQKKKRKMPKFLKNVSKRVNSGQKLKTLLKKASPRWKRVFNYWGEGEFKCWCYDDFKVREHCKKPSY